MKKFITQLSKDLFQTKIEIEKELSEGNKLIMKIPRHGFIGAKYTLLNKSP